MAYFYSEFKGMTGLAGQQYDNMCANWGAAANYPGLTNPAMVSLIGMETCSYKLYVPISYITYKLLKRL